MSSRSSTSYPVTLYFSYAILRLSPPEYPAPLHSHSHKFFPRTSKNRPCYPSEICALDFNRNFDEPRFGWFQRLSASIDRFSTARTTIHCPRRGGKIPSAPDLHHLNAAAEAPPPTTRTLPGAAAGSDSAGNKHDASQKNAIRKSMGRLCHIARLST
jgi:hypothetical protein